MATYKRKIKIYREGNKKMYKNAHIIGRIKGGKFAIWRDGDELSVATHGMHFWWKIISFNIRWVYDIIAVMCKLSDEYTTGDGENTNQL